MSAFAQPIAQKLNITIQQVEAVLNLFGEGATIPFIARYRKDKTGALDEVQIQQIQDEAKFLKEFSERKTFIEKTITEQGKMTEALQAKINKASTIARASRNKASRKRSSRCGKTLSMPSRAIWVWRALRKASVSRYLSARLSCWSFFLPR